MIRFKFKKLSAIFLSTVLAATLVGCGGGTTQTEQPTQEPAPSTEQPATDEFKAEEGASLVVWESKDKEQEVMKQIAEKFTAETGIPVKVEQVESPDQLAKLTTDGPAGLGADVVTFPHDGLGTAVATGLILPNDYFEEETNTEYMENAVKAVTMDGILYGYPKSIETYALFYNKDLIPEAPKTFDEVIAYAKENTDVKNNKYGFMWDVGNFYFSYSFLAGFGGYVFKDGTNPEDIGLNNEGAVEGAKFIQSLKEILPLNSGDITGDVKTSLFTDGKLALNIDGPWAIGGFKEAGVNFGVAPLPKLPNGEHPASFSGVKAFYVNAYTKYPNAAKLFARFATSQESQKQYFEVAGLIPARTDLQDVVSQDEIAKALFEQFTYSSPMPSISQMGAVWTPGAAAISAIWNDNKDPKAALDEAVEQIKQTMQ